MSVYQGILAVCSGGFDPVHSGHVRMLQAAQAISGQGVVVLLNSDAWLTAKKGRAFMSFAERREVIQAMSSVAEVLEMDDSAGDCCKALEALQLQYPDKRIVFCNGGDRTEKNIPEMQVSGIEFAFGVGGDHKANSSSALLNNWEHRVQDRVWGTFRDLFKDQNVRVKELVIAPGQGISYQRHFRRSEFWVVSSGSCQIKFSFGSPERFRIATYHAGDHIHIPELAWHQVFNENCDPCHIIEVQFGQYSTEEDIERLEYYKAK